MIHRGSSSERSCGALVIAIPFDETAMLPGGNAAQLQLLETFQFGGPVVVEAVLADSYRVR